MTTNTEEKDNYWLIAGGVVAAVILTVFLIKGNEHGKYVSTAKAIAEDSTLAGHVTRNN